MDEWHGVSVGRFGVDYRDNVPGTRRAVKHSMPDVHSPGLVALRTTASCFSGASEPDKLDSPNGNEAST